MSAFSFFDAVYVIHLPNAERRRLIDAELERLQLPQGVEFVHAAPAPETFVIQNFRRNPRGHFSASLSHLKAWVKAIGKGAQHALFIEDDVEFSADAEASLAMVLQQLPPQWNVIFFGGHPRRPVKRYSARLVRAGLWSICECYAIHGGALPRLVDFFCDRTTKPDAAVDIMLGEFADMYGAAFATYPLLTMQRPGMSQITQDWVDTRQLVERGWKNNLT